MVNIDLSSLNSEAEMTLKRAVPEDWLAKLDYKVKWSILNLEVSQIWKWTEVKLLLQQFRKVSWLIQGIDPQYPLNYVSPELTVEVFVSHILH